MTVLPINCSRTKSVGGDDGQADDNDSSRYGKDYFDKEVRNLTSVTDSDTVIDASDA